MIEEPRHPIEKIEGNHIGVWSKDVRNRVSILQPNFIYNQIALSAFKYFPRISKRSAYARSNFSVVNDPDVLFEVGKLRGQELRS